MAFLRICTLALALGSVASMNLVHRKSNFCLDLFSPCVDGTDDVKCQKTPTSDLKPGTKLQLAECNGRPNQEFTFLSNGRIQNPSTELCIDIPAPCKDHYRTPCERVAVKELKGKQHVQLYTCHKDTGLLSNSYGNQKWNFERSMIRNNESNLCLEAIVGEETETSKKNVANVQTETCDGSDDQIYDFLDSAASAQGANQKFALSGHFDVGVPALIGDKAQSHNTFAFAGIAIAGLFASVAFVTTRRFRQDVAQVDVEMLNSEPDAE